MATAMPARCFHCPLCNESFPTFAAFDSEDHKCCIRIANTPGILEKIIAARAEHRAKERRAAARYIALFISPDPSRI